MEYLIKAGRILLLISMLSLSGRLTGQDATVRTVDFNTFSGFFQNKNDSILVINFWATWCAPCVEELPYFEKIHDTFKDQKVKVILASLDFQRMKETRLIPFIERNQLKSQVVHLYEPDANKWISQIDSDWTGAIPATLILFGHQRIFKEGQYTFDELNQIILKLLNSHKQ